MYTKLKRTLNICLALSLVMLALGTVYGLQTWEENQARYDQ